MVDAHTLEKLQFDVVRGALSAHCASSVGRPLARALRPTSDRKTIVRWLEQVRQMAVAVIEVGAPPLAGMSDIRTVVTHAADPGGLEAEDLARISETLRAMTTLRLWLAQVRPALALIHGFGVRIADFQHLADRIDEAVDSRGQVRDDASPKLASIRHAIERGRAQIKVAFDRLLGQKGVGRYLQYHGTTFHEDRMVLPLKAEHRGRVPGIVHRTSETGETLFIEPAEAVELNNSIVALADDERKEIRRVLAELSRYVHAAAEEILPSLATAGVIDLIHAKVRYAKFRNAVCPDISEDGTMELRQARHPVLLDLFTAEAKGGGPVRQVMPIDVRLGGDFDVLVITGPNTGGKTVTLKTIGLMCVMAQAGVPIPAAAGSKVPVFTRLSIDVGDEQSLEQSLSTFSSHLSNILYSLDQADEHSLLLIDELGAGTDPDEGAAIGRAVVDEVLRRKSKAVITTHLSALKTIAFTEDRVDNASVEFDAVSLRPTYVLRLGEPGNSNAIVIAERLGMPPHMVSRAKACLAGDGSELRQAIAGTLESRRQAEHAREEATAARLEAEQRQREYESKAADLARRQREYHGWVEWVRALSPGDEVYVPKFERTARVARINVQQQTAIVSAGALEYELALGELQPPDRRAAPRR